jgi:hypothetical protein
MGEDPSELRLTRREKEVVRLVAEGYTYWETTDMLKVGSGVVRNLLDGIYKKLQLHWGNPDPHDFDELLIDLEIDEAGWAVVFGLLVEMERK